MPSTREAPGSITSKGERKEMREKEREGGRDRRGRERNRRKGRKNFKKNVYPSSLQRAAFKIFLPLQSWFSPSTVWVPGIKLRPSGLSGSLFTC